MKKNIMFYFAFQALILEAFESISGSLEIGPFFENLFSMAYDNVDHNEKPSKGYYRVSQGFISLQRVSFGFIGFHRTL